MNRAGTITYGSAIVLTAVVVALFFLSGILRTRDVVGLWHGISDNTVVIGSDHMLRIKRAGGIEVCKTGWSETPDGISIGRAVGYEDLNSRFYKVEVRHNGNTLKMTSERGDVLVFERVSN